MLLMKEKRNADEGAAEWIKEQLERERESRKSTPSALFNWMSLKTTSIELKRQMT